MYKKLINLLDSQIKKLETVEEKAFWLISIAACAVGVISLLTTTDYYPSKFPTVFAAVLFCGVHGTLMLVACVYKNYHVLYPIMSIALGTITIPLTLVTNGGLESGMPFFCVASICTSALCYERKWRISSLLLSLISTIIAFFYIYEKGTPFPIVSEWSIFCDKLFGLVFSSLALFLCLDYVIVEIRRYRISQKILQQYFDTGKRERILSSQSQRDFFSTGERKKATVIFADITRFTTAAERMEPEVTAKFLNDFFSIAESAIHMTNGIIDKYIGDCVMAYWLEVPGENCVLNAVKSLLQIKQELYLESENLFDKYGTEINFTAGISYGDVILANIGSEQMHDYTIIGDTVNTASRIQQYASGGELLISDSAAYSVNGLVELEPMKTGVFLNGKSAAINVYRVLEIKGKAESIDINRASSTACLYICGCRGSFPVSGIRFSEYGGETSCYILKKNDYAVIIDCGTGLKNAGKILEGCRKIDMLLTHVHYDHILGLLFAKMPDCSIRAFGNFGEWLEDQDRFLHFMEHPYWPVKPENISRHDVVIGEKIQLEEGITAEFFRSDHPDNTCVIRIMCDGKKICFFSDCEDPNKLDPEISANSDLLLIDGMFDEEEIESHRGWGHGTWQGGIEFGKKQGVKKLIITHHNPECGDHTLLSKEKEARTSMENVSFAKAGDSIQI